MPTIHLLSLQHLHVIPEPLVLTVPGMIKQSRGFFSNPVIVLPRFLEDTRFCAVDCFENYLLRTAGYRNNAEKRQVFLSYVSLTSLSVEIRLVGGLNQCFPQQE